jgi:predicted dehydrogenase
LVVGCGNMGASHATAYHTRDGFELVGLVSTGQSKHVLNAQLGGGYAVFEEYAEVRQGGILEFIIGDKPARK